MADCIFCRIAAGDIPCREVHADTDFVAFRDLNPQAPVHFLVIPRRHVAALTDLTGADADLVGRLQVTAAQVAAKLGLAETGYRFVINCGRDACQTVPHLHLHVLGGRALGWPPG
ncbi:MAG TPA: histidine triad nucleotide-binding protein [Candidatus Krumholzibacteria bacterium]|nr:histidine triad nucleotide-binding protein [Candidatus Krumholzibacteria bacterium]HPD71740.1 histidine triad nucleotide-binding protein [Candidatus Krumholzibacteria bacterium]HRY41327.1 histidine triad nucleotide-binding protein [Candidatus Krumholzibacteria bacterium]